MKTILKIVTVLLIAVAFIGCGTSSYLEVRERPGYYRSVRPGYYYSTPPPHYYRGPGYWHSAPRGGYYYRRGRWHR